jgi:hypothetical protein
MGLSGTHASEAEIHAVGAMPGEGRLEEHGA